MKNRRSLLRAFSLLLALTTLMLSFGAFAGCSDTSINDYPVNVAGVYIEERPEVIVSLSNDITAVIVEMGYVDHLDGCLNDSGIPEVRKLTPCGTTEKPSAESVIALGADLVLCGTDLSTEVLDMLADADITVIQLLTPVSRTALSNLYRCVGAAMNGAVTGYNDGDAAVQRILVRMDDVERTVMGEGTKNVCIFTNSGLNQAVTGDCLGNVVIELAGGFNVAVEGVNGSITLDAVAQADPDVILCPEGCEDVVRSKRELEACAAIKNNKIYAYDPSRFSALNDELILATWELSRLLHPDIVTPDMMPGDAVDYLPTYDDQVLHGEEYEAYLSSVAAEQAATTPSPFH